MAVYKTLRTEYNGFINLDCEVFMNTIKRSGRRGRPFSRLLRKLKRFFRKAKISVSGFFSKLGAKIKRIDIPAFFRKLSKN